MTAIADGMPLVQQRVRAGVEAAADRGTGTLPSPQGLLRMNHRLARLTRWYPPAEVLRMATGANGDLLALSGEHSPDGRVGLIAEDAMADLLRVDGDPIADIRRIEDPERTVRIIMTDGKIVRNSL